MGLSWRRWAAQGPAIEIPVVDVGAAQLLLAPGETFVQYQLWAQEMGPDSFVMVMGYGECSPGHIPTKKAVSEGWKDDSWDWVDHSLEDILVPLRSFHVSGSFHVELFASEPHGRGGRGRRGRSPSQTLSATLLGLASC